MGRRVAANRGRRSSAIAFIADSGRWFTHRTRSGEGCGRHGRSGLRDRCDRVVHGSAWDETRRSMRLTRRGGGAFTVKPHRLLVRADGEPVLDEQLLDPRSAEVEPPPDLAEA